MEFSMLVRQYLYNETSPTAYQSFDLISDFEPPFIDLIILIWQQWLLSYFFWVSSYESAKFYKFVSCYAFLTMASGFIFHLHQICMETIPWYFILRQLHLSKDSLARLDSDSRRIGNIWEFKITLERWIPIQRSFCVCAQPMRDGVAV